MKSSTTLILLVLAVGLGAWMLWPHGDGPRDLGGHLLFDWSWSTRHDDKEKVRVDVDAAKVTGIDLKSSAVEIPLRKMPDGAWELNGSVKDRADASIVKELLDYLGKARISD